MISKNIYFKKFNFNYKNTATKKNLNLILNSNNEVINSLKSDFKLNYKFKKIKKNLHLRIIGVGGSILGAKAIYNFLKKKIKRKVYFIDNLNNQSRKNKKKFTNLIISKSGNTVETIVNSNILIKKKDENLFITENKNSYLTILAQKMKSEIIHHNNYIGGRYSVLCETGMVPAHFMGLKIKKFKQLNNLVKNKNFLNSLISNVNSTLFFLKKKKFNSVIINYDESSDSLFKWYQQLLAESLGKKNTGILPVISTMPMDNHSVMQLYLDGFKNNFFTFFYVNESRSPNILNHKILASHNFLKNKNIDQILYAQKKSTENVFKKKNIPFRTFEIKNRNEETIGELFCFFMLETILLAKALKLNPFDQPAVELIKKETKKILI